MKTCERCLQLKRPCEFYAHRKSRDGLSKACKACRTEVAAERRNTRRSNGEPIRDEGACTQCLQVLPLVKRFPHCGKCHKEYRLRESRKWIEANPEKYEDRLSRLRERAKRVYALNPRKYIDVANAYREKYPEKAAATRANARAKRLLRVPGWLTPADLARIEFIYFLAKCTENATGVPHHVDHILPLLGRKVSGLHVPDNLQILTASENLRKGNAY